MKTAKLLTLLTAGLATVSLYAQTPTEPPPVVPVVPPAAPGEVAATPETPPAPTTPAGAEAGTPAVVTPPPATIEATNPNAIPVAPTDGKANEIKKSDEGFIIKDAGLNDIFQYLSKSAGKQYFHNSKIAGPEFLVTGHLNEGDPLQQMEELAFMYGLSLHTKGNTIYALTQAQLSQLPSAEFHYQLRYLRPTDVEAIKDLIRPMLSPGTGIVNFEPKTNTIIIIDSAHRIEQAQQLLHGIDQAKGQIIVETKILRVNTSAAERTGVNWHNALGKESTTSAKLSLSRNLNAIFGLPVDTTGTAFVDSNLVLSPLQVSGVLSALAEGNLASQISNPTLITEDNEQATISIIDRIPIITSTTTAATTPSGQPTVTEEVRYKIDTSDKTIDTSPESHREIGISLVVTPTLLPDGTVRMRMRPRSAQIVETITSVAGNKYPRVTESMVESLARVPDGYSLVVGGFYGETKSDAKTKIPLIGDIPVINFFFKSKEAVKEKTSLVFVVTPTSYNPTNAAATKKAGSLMRSNTTIDGEYNWVDPENPGPAHEPNLQRSLRGLQPAQAPCFPRVEEVAPSTTGRSATSSSPRFPRAKR